MCQKVNKDEKIFLNKLFTKNDRNEEEFLLVLKMIKKYNVIKDCYNKASYFIEIASNTLNIFEDCKEKEILKKLTYFSIKREF